MSHCRTSAFDNHLYHSFTVLQRVLEVSVCCWAFGPHQTTDQPFGYTVRSCLSRVAYFIFVCMGFGLLLLSFRECGWFLGVLVDRNTSLTTSQRFKARRPSIRSPAPNEIISDSVELWDTDVCFLHIQLTRTSVRLPNIHKLPVTEVDFKSSRSSAKSESWEKPIDSAVLCCTRDNGVGSHLCDGYTKSILPNVCSMPESIV